MWLTRGTFQKKSGLVHVLIVKEQQENINLIKFRILRKFNLFDAKIIC